MTDIKIILADDHKIVLDGINMILSSNDEFNVIGEFENGQEVLDFLNNNAVDVVVMDINMPLMDGITCSRHIKEKHPETKVIILTMYPQKSFIEEIIKIGIDGCLLKNNTGKELSDAIIRVTSGKSYYDQIQTFDSNEDKVKKYKLSEREIEIIQSLAEGLSSADIADKYFISLHTVKTHRKNILKKLNLHATPELIQYAINQGII